MKEEKILIIDDSRDDIECFGEILQRIGYTNLTSTSEYSKALEILEEQKPDVLFLDTMMKDVLGYNVCKQVREMPFGDDMVIIGMSSYEGYKNDWLEAGADDFIGRYSQSDNELGDIIQKAIVRRK